MHTKRLLYESVAKRYKPKGWRVRYSKRRAASGSGLADGEKRTIYAPHPYTREGLYVLLHEYAHVHLKHLTNIPLPLTQQEYEAEKWAAHIMRTEGIPVPRSCTRDAKAYIQSHIDKYGETSPHIRKWARE